MELKLQPGDKAPAFTATDQNGDKISLSDYKGKKVVLFFYPKDNTPTCTNEACNIRDNYALLKKNGMVVLGISIDTEKSHKKFEQKHGLPFPLVADPDRKIVEAYGVWGLKKFMGREFMGTHRTTFLINEKGIIEHIIEKVVSKDHTTQILDLWK
ncbi:thioredoxin-dependent thiol peroxidase [Taibaiella chishuiensis]|uniref:thioredoxin-dependent peroxiredoxin n=1 Tax=Taibaiella chishuiensis TaxID=1434707 RepID=A0A2P8DB25_9BACT|nr:thioredoxin-dependent thiol peroxidase [Taibaiella chishuiensis]PSK94424.1 peroxiredoxin Q/BCP [Taibaiella chishuiensis]